MVTLFDIDEKMAESPRKTKDELRREERERIKADWKAADEEARRCFYGHREILVRFRAEMERLFRAMEGEPKVYKRRPNISLRLIAEGEPRTKLIALPNYVTWSSDRRQQCPFIDPTRVTCELIEERDVQGRDGPAKRRQEVLSFHINPPTSTPFFHAGAIRRCVADDIERAVAVIKAFLDDHHAVLARAQDNCGICGRVLTDELSRSRGIGPECIHKAPWLAVYDEDSIIVPAAS